MASPSLVSATPSAPPPLPSPPAPSPPPFIAAPPSHRDNPLNFLYFLIFVGVFILVCLVIWFTAFGAKYINSGRYRQRLKDAKKWMHDKKRSLRSFESRLLVGPHLADAKGNELLGVLPPPARGTAYWAPLDPTTVWQVVIPACEPDIKPRVNPHSQPYPDLKFWMLLECTSPPGATIQTFEGAGQLQTYGYYQVYSRRNSPNPFAGQHVHIRSFRLLVTAAAFSTATGKGYVKFRAVRDGVHAKQGRGGAAQRAEAADADGEVTFDGAGEHPADAVLYFVRAHPNDEATIYGTLFTAVGAWDTPLSTRLNKFERSSYSSTTHVPLLAEFNGGFDAPPPAALPLGNPYRDHYHPLRQVYQKPMMIELPPEELRDVEEPPRGHRYILWPWYRRQRKPAQAPSEAESEHQIVGTDGAGRGPEFYLGAADAAARPDRRDWVGGPANFAPPDPDAAGYVEEDAAGGPRRIPAFEAV